MPIGVAGLQDHGHLPCIRPRGFDVLGHFALAGGVWGGQAFGLGCRVKVRT